VEGLVDYREARPRDRQWWQRWRLLMRGLSQRQEARIADADFRFHLAQIGNADLDEKASQKQALEARDRLIEAIQPWRPAAAAKSKEEAFKNYRQMYADAFGVDPADPAFVEWTRSRPKEEPKPRPETVSQRAARRRREAEERRRHGRKAR
jgi:hypothetical protein